MNPSADISQLPLRDIHLPGAIGWWPPAPGWWVLGALLVAALALAGLAFYRSRHRRAARKALERTRAALEQGVEPVLCLQNVSTVLRRFVMTRAARAGHAAMLGPDMPGLIGERWLKYLDSCWQRDEFERGAGRALLAAPYSRPGSVDRGAALELTALCTEWLAAQKRPPRRRRAAYAGGA